MKVSREKAKINRARVVETAGRLFRERGVDGIGIADLMRASGMTHGGFYGQFASKEALAAESIADITLKSADKWLNIAANTPQNAVREIANEYLSDRHLNAPATGCALPTLSGDAARKGGPMAETMRDGIEVLALILEQADPDRGRKRALAAVAQMAGAMMLARAVGDPDLAQEIMAAGREALAEQGASTALDTNGVGVSQRAIEGE